MVFIKVHTLDIDLDNSMFDNPQNTNNKDDQH